eukprot:SAG11_NODE_29383_length_311_cov_1.023585_1_plen_70_part_00
MHLDGVAFLERMVKDARSGGDVGTTARVLEELRLKLEGALLWIVWSLIVRVSKIWLDKHFVIVSPLEVK